MFDLMKIWTSKISRQQRVSILGLPFGSPEKKCHLDVALTESHIAYYKEGNGASSQRLQVV
jgi:hypothetical protein